MAQAVSIAPDRTRRLRASTLVVVAVAFLALSGVLVRWSEVGPAATGGWRALLAIPILWVTAIIAGRRRDGEEPAAKARATGADNLWIVLSGVFLGADLILWHISFDYTSLGESNLLANLVPFIAAPLSVLLFGERIPARVLWPALIACGGLYVLLLGGSGFEGDHFFGNLLAMLTAFFYAAFLLSVKHLRRRLDSTYIMMRGSVFTGLTCLAAGLVLGEPLLPTSLAGVGVLVVLAFTAQVMGQSLMAHAIVDLRLPVAVVLVLLQPVIASLYGLAFFGETLSALQILGMAAVLVSIYWVRLILEGQSK
ncbi:DMT family transporter [Glycomyces halotolerans]